MKTIKAVNITVEYVEFMPEFIYMKEAVIYISEEYHVSIHKCLCGCGTKTVLPINLPGTIKKEGWDLIKNDPAGYNVSFTPSIYNYQVPCKSHYIITKNVANFV